MFRVIPKSIHDTVSDGYGFILLEKKKGTNFQMTKNVNENAQFRALILKKKTKNLCGPKHANYFLLI